MNFTLAHLSDVHLGPLPSGAFLRRFRLKRVVGAASWVTRRRQVHLPEVANAIRASIVAGKPDHIACTGDMVNIAAWREFPPAAAWLNGLGSSEALSFTPGNHDAYVPVPWQQGLAHFVPWMQDDKRDAPPGPGMFPFLRLRRNVALLGVSTAVPQAIGKAGGTLGPQQLARIDAELKTLGERGFFRVLMIHHPPLPCLCPPRKELTDVAALQDILKARGCELALHGHNHKRELHWLDTRSGPCPVVGAPSASMADDLLHHPAAWYRFRIQRTQGNWQTEMTAFQWNPQTRTVEAEKPAMLLPPAPARVEA